LYSLYSPEFTRNRLSNGSSFILSDFRSNINSFFNSAGKISKDFYNTDFQTMSTFHSPLQHVKGIESLGSKFGVKDKVLLKAFAETHDLE
jgi:hypothetical protein